jgi:serine/threonine protein kinase
MYMVFPYMEHDLSGLLENPAVQFTEPQIKCYLMQLLEGLKYLHAVRTPLDRFTSGTLSNNLAATHPTSRHER